MVATALGILEVRGMTALAAAVDAMGKAAQVRLTGRHGIGSGWLTVVIDGETGHVETAMEAGCLAAAERGDVITAAVVPRPEGAAIQPMPHVATGIEVQPIEGAIGILETKGVTPLAAGTDAMVKAADVELQGWAYIGGALVHALVTGSVDAVETAVTAGEDAARRVGECHGQLVLSQPEPEVRALYPSTGMGERRASGALGFVETTGYVGAAVAGDAMVKAGDIELVRLTIGSGGRVATLAAGRLDEVRAAIHAGADAAAGVAELNGHVVLSRPDEAVMGAFAVSDAPTPARAQAGEAMGLVETRTTVGLVKALDEMLKNADVVYEGRYKVGYFLTACVVRGETGAVQTAIDVARRTVGRYGELVAAHVIPYPSDAMETRLPHA